VSYCGGDSPLNRFVGVPGPRGPKGDPGSGAGDPGPKGDKGDPGVPGRDGVDGAPGRDGSDGAPGRDGVDGQVGPRGEKGSDGADGRDGVDGKDGVDGQDGAPGRDGVDGQDGVLDAGLAPVKPEPEFSDELLIVDGGAVKRSPWSAFKVRLALWLEDLTATWSNKTLVAPKVSGGSMVDGVFIGEADRSAAWAGWSGLADRFYPSVGFEVSTPLGANTTWNNPTAGGVPGSDPVRVVSGNRVFQVGDQGTDAFSFDVVDPDNTDHLVIIGRFSTLDQSRGLAPAGSATGLRVNPRYEGSTGNVNGLALNSPVYQDGTAAYSVLSIQPREYTVGTGSRYLIDAGVFSATNVYTRRFAVTPDGAITFTGTVNVNGVPAVTTTGVQTLSNKTFTGSTSFSTVVGKNTLTVGTNSNWVNGLNIFGNVTGGAAQILATGEDPDVSIRIVPKGEGIIFGAGSDRVGIKLPAVPATATSDGKPGEWAADNGFIYVCTANDTWRRAALQTW
jgi:hypothetical protein